MGRMSTCVKFSVLALFYAQTDRKTVYVAIIQRITSCNKNRMTTCVITFWYIHVTSLKTMGFLIEKMFNLKLIKSHLYESYDRQNLTLVS